jgi:hypothetical protein
MEHVVSLSQAEGWWVLSGLASHIATTLLPPACRARCVMWAHGRLWGITGNRSPASDRLTAQFWALLESAGAAFGRPGRRERRERAEQSHLYCVVGLRRGGSCARVDGLRCPSAGRPACPRAFFSCGLFNPSSCPPPPPLRGGAPCVAPAQVRPAGPRAARHDGGAAGDRPRHAAVHLHQVRPATGLACARCVLSWRWRGATRAASEGFSLLGDADAPIAAGVDSLFRGSGHKRACPLPRPVWTDPVRPSSGPAIALQPRASGPQRRRCRVLVSFLPLILLSPMTPHEPSPGSPSPYLRSRLSYYHLPQSNPPINESPQVPVVARTRLPRGRPAPSPGARAGQRRLRAHGRGRGKGEAAAAAVGGAAAQHGAGCAGRSRLDGVALRCSP